MEEALKLPRAEAQAQAKTAPARLPAFSDPNALRYYVRLTTLLLLVTLMLLASLVGNFVQWYTGPSLAIGIQKPNGDVQWTSYNGVPVQAQDGSVQVGPNVVLAGDKTYYAGEFARLLYAPDPATRTPDVQRALRMMVDDKAGKLIACLNRGCQEYDLNLDQQRAEVWQVVWKEQEKYVDRNDPWTVNIIGLQQLTRVVKGAAVKETRQISLSIKLVQDTEGRAERNQRSGVRVESFQYKLITNSAQ